MSRSVIRLENNKCGFDFFKIQKGKMNYKGGGKAFLTLHRQMERGKEEKVRPKRIM